MKSVTRLQLVRAAALSVATSIADHAWGQDAPHATETSSDVVIVNGVLGFDAPTTFEFALDESRIAAEVYADTRDLLSDLAGSLGITTEATAQTFVVLIDGHPAASDDEVAAIPLSSIASVTVFAGAQSVRLGYASNQYVVSIVLKTTGLAFHLKVTAETGIPGGRYGFRLEPQVFYRSPQDRLSATFLAENSRGWTSFQEEIRNAASTAGSTVDPPVVDSASLQLDYARTLAPWLSASIGVDLRETHTDLPTVFREQTFPAIGRLDDRRAVTNSTSSQLRVGLSGKIYLWRFDSTLSDTKRASSTKATLTSGTYDVVERNGHTESMRLTVRGPILPLPTGVVLGSFGYETLRDRLKTSQQSGSTLRTGSVTLQQKKLSYSAVIPVIDQSAETARSVGTVSIAVGGKITEDSRQSISSSHATIDWGSPAGLRMRVTREKSGFIKPIETQDTVFVEYLDAAIYDPTTDDIVLADIVVGNNESLPRIRSDITRVDLTYRPLDFEGLALFARYEELGLQNFAFQFSRLTSLFEQAYPDRIFRGVDGTLTRVDLSPVLIGESITTNMHFGATLESPNDMRSALSDEPQEQRSRWKVSAFYRKALVDDVFWAALGRRLPRRAALPSAIGAAGDTFEINGRYVVGQVSMQGSVRWSEGKVEPDSDEVLSDAYTAKIGAVWRPADSACETACGAFNDTTLRFEGAISHQPWLRGDSRENAVSALQWVDLTDYRLQVSFEKRF